MKKLMFVITVSIAAVANASVVCKTVDKSILDLSIELNTDHKLNVSDGKMIYYNADEDTYETIKIENNFSKENSSFAKFTYISGIYAAYYLTVLSDKGMLSGIIQSSPRGLGEAQFAYQILGKRGLEKFSCDRK